MSLRRLNKHRAALAGTLVVAILLVGVFHAPVIPVSVGCVLALALQFVRTAGKPEDH